ncbi:DUF992 domain-containing protein [Acuticoccus sp. M5D2P5]|uniref:DUF992 domain-containing protein n=1 Tax=Acuticoccus kalidii TaxID=2910977 RepID=UPI001F2E1449|nr:DUF992 domain-containing protein [Acuticoccus kalidii]MCF3933952.1 DUF992 domain-containing protein [Acuticoccus kalidii]
MLRLFSAALVALSAIWVAAPTPAKADFGIRVGLLTCHVDGGFGLILGSRKTLQCQYDGVGGTKEIYEGSITKLGVDLGETGGSAIAWAVFAPTTQLSPGALEGHYYGVTAEVTPGVGVGANVLIGGFDRSINLQPVSLQGQVGANIAAGIAGMRLRNAVPQPPIVVKP